MHREHSYGRRFRRIDRFSSYSERRTGASWSFLILVAVLLPASWIPVAKAQMVSPDIDRSDQPFSYFSQPTDEIGVMNAPSATEISPEGYLYSGYGELMFFLGPEQTPLSARIRTMEDGDLPVLFYSVTHLGIVYTFTAFAAQVPSMPATDSTPTGEVVNFVRVTMHNPGIAPRAAFLTTAIRYQAPQTTEAPMADNRYIRPATAPRVGDYQQPGEAFNSGWSYSMDHGACYRQGRALYLYPQLPGARLSLTLRTHYNRIEPLSSVKLDLSPITPVCSVMDTLPLAPGESRSVDLRMPLIPAERGSAAFAALAAASFDVSHTQVVRFWKMVLAQGMQIELPEAKPVETFNASLVYDLLGRNIVDGQFVQTANQFQYHRFYLRDSADYVRMYDATGYKDIGSQVVAFFATRQLPNGNFLSQPGEYDGWGEALWTYGEHYRRTHDLAFARSVYPSVVRAVDWLVQARAKDPLHVMPASDVRDNEYVSGHITGYNFLALDGLQSAIQLAQVLGHSDDAERFQREYQDYRATFLALLAKATVRDGGVLPPSLDAGKWRGTDWGNLLSVVPEPVLNPWDPRVTATLKYTQARYQEGIMTYSEPDDGTFLHHYLTIKNTLTELVRGEQEQAIHEFYAELLHTGSTHTGFEYAIRPWGSRDFEGNLAPHNWFAADYRNLLRNMMVREEEGDLHLLSAVSPEWVGEGRTIRVTKAPTYFGTVGFTLTETNPDSAVLRIDSDFQTPPHAIVLHLPWFLEVSRMVADGKPVPVQDGAVRLPADTREVRMEWSSRLHVRMSYDRTVTSYEAEYRRRYALLLRTGEMSSKPDTWHVPEH
jgi:hypothetical protein